MVAGRKEVGGLRETGEGSRKPNSVVTKQSRGRKVQHGEYSQ